MIPIINVRENRRYNQEWIIQRHWLWVWCLNATFNNISVIIMVVSFIGGGNRSTRRKHWPAGSHRHTWSHNVVVSSTPRLSGIQTIGRIRHRTKTNKTQKHNTTQKTKQMNNTDPTNNWECDQVHAKGNQLLPLIRHSPCYTPIYIYIVKTCLTPLYANTNNIKKTWTLIQTTWGKDHNVYVLV